MITVPTGGSIHTDTVKSLLLLQSDLQKKGLRYHFNFSKSSFLPHGRAQVCGASLDRGKFQKPYGTPEITHILMVDSDIEFKPEDFWRLWNHNLPVVAGAYCYSTESRASEEEKRIVAGTWDVDFFRKHYTFPAYTLGEARSMAAPLLEVDWLGLGFALVRTEVFAKIEYPWFNSELIVIDDLRDTTSEDVGWCRKVKAAGYRIMLDPAVKVGHQKTVTI
jgi:hypothetical protein